MTEAATHHDVRPVYSHRIDSAVCVRIPGEYLSGRQVEGGEAIAGLPAEPVEVTTNVDSVT